VPELAPMQPAPEPLPADTTIPLPNPFEWNDPLQQEPGEGQLARRVAHQRPRASRDFSSRQRKSGSEKHNRVVGLKVGASQVAAAYLVNKGGPRIVRMARMPLRRGIVVGGELREPEELAGALKSFFRKNKLPQSCVRLGISNNRIGVRTFEIAGIDDEKQLANAIRFRAQETLPIPLDEAVLDYRILDERRDEEGALVRRVLLVVAHRELVERYVAACRKAGLKLIGIDLEAFALLRALSDPADPPAADAAVVCVSIGHDRSTLAVSDGEVCEFTRVLAWGGSVLDAALARVLDLTPSAVEPIKHELVLGQEGEVAGLDAPAANEARAAMVAELQTFARELVASLRFYQEQPNSLGVAEILLTGGAAVTPGLATELQRLIGIPVRVADPLTRVRVPRHLQEAQSGAAASLAVAVGLAIED
jgi:type IV pilus assembly protein PilM